MARERQVYCVEQPNGVLDQAVRDRLCLLAHDLNNALGAIAGHCELMAEHAESDSEFQARLRKILTITHNMAKRINGHECRMAAPPLQAMMDLYCLSKPVRSPEKTARPADSQVSNPAKAG